MGNMFSHHKDDIIFKNISEKDRIRLGLKNIKNKSFKNIKK